MQETLLQKAQRLGIKPAVSPVANNSGTETLLQKAQRLGIKPTTTPRQPLVKEQENLVAPQAIEQFKTGFSQIKEGVNLSKPNPALVGRGVLNELGGGLNLVFSPITELISQTSKLPVISDALKFVKKYTVDQPADAISDIPALQEFMRKYPNADEVASNLITIGTSFAGGKNAPAIKGATVRGVETGLNTLKKVTDPISTPLQNSAESSIIKALGPTTKANKAIATKLAPQILERPAGETFAFTRKGLEEKALAGKEKAGQAIEDFGKLEGETETYKILDALEQEKAQYVAGGRIVDPVAYGKLGEVQKIIENYGDTIDNETLRGVRRIFDKEINKAKGFTTPPSEGSLLDAKKLASDRIRGLLAEGNPELAKINKEYTFWSNLEKVIGETNKRDSGKGNFIGDLATIGGAVTGQGAVNTVAKALTFRWLATVVKSTGWRLVSARIKNTIADSIAVGDFVTANNTLSKISLSDKQNIHSQEWSKMKQRGFGGIKTVGTLAGGTALGTVAGNIPKEVEFKSDLPQPDAININPSIIEGINIESYATDPEHEMKIQTIYDSLPEFKNADEISKHIKSKAPNSPITGQMIENASKKYNVSPKLLISIMRQDSNLGTKGLGVKTRNPGNVANNDSGSTFTYPSWQEGVYGVARFLAKNKVKKQNG